MSESNVQHLFGYGDESLGYTKFKSGEHRF